MHDLQLLRRPPWALLGAVLLLFAAEAGLREVRPSGAVPYLKGEGEYRSLVMELQRIGAPEVVVLGSSRAREAVLSKELAAGLNDRLGCSTKAGNYALPGAHAQEVELVVPRLLRRIRRRSWCCTGLALASSWPSLGLW